VVKFRDFLFFILVKKTEISKVKFLTPQDVVEGVIKIVTSSGEKCTERRERREGAFPLKILSSIIPGTGDGHTGASGCCGRVNSRRWHTSVL